MAHLPPLTDPLRSNITNPMPPFPQARHQHVTTQQPSVASIPPVMASHPATNHTPSPELGTHISITPTNIQITHGVNAILQSSLNLHIQSSSNETSVVRILPQPPPPPPGQGYSSPVPALSAQNTQGVQNPPASISFGSFNSAITTKPAKRVVFNNGEPGIQDNQEVPSPAPALNEGDQHTLEGQKDTADKSTYHQRTTSIQGTIDPNNERDDLLTIV
ncbi:unnamed protein product [Ilex paraguariensis]|uniref:Uncharacterized protein n=1 Tax=Ilex paraguariensis TaxID=185542 RepID=A0ABC8SD50_9AQUA